MVSPAKHGYPLVVTEQTVNAVRRAYHAFSAGDPDAMLELLDPDVEWSEHETGAGGKILRGHEDVRNWLYRTHEFVDKLEIEPVELIDAGAEIVAVVDVRVTSHGTRIRVAEKEAHVFAFEGNRATRVCGFSGRAEALAAVGLDA